MYAMYVRMCVRLYVLVYDTCVRMSCVLCSRQIDELHTARQRLSAEMADNSNGIKNMIVRAEDARLMKNM